MPVRDDNIGKSIQIESSKPSSKRNVQKDKRNKKKKKVVSRKYTITGNIVSLQAGQDNPVNKITSDLVGATLSVTNPHTLVDTNRYPSTRYTLPTTYSTTISKVINETTFEVSEPYYVTDDTLQKIPVSLEQGSISITYDTYKTETENSVFQRSFAELTIGNLRTFSGDVYKAKIYTRDSHTSTDFEEIYDTFVVPENILVDSTSINGYENIGFFHTGSIIANNWVSSSTNTETEPFVSLNNEKLIDGVQISGSTQNLEDKVTFRTKNSFDLEQSVDYVVRFNSYYFKSISKRRDDNDDVSDVNHASLKIYLSGSAITGQNGEDDFFLGEVDVPDSLGDEGSIPDVVGRFRTAGSGSPKAWLKFELNSGRFIVQDVSIEPFSETNFNPSFFKVLAPMPKAVRRGDKYDFLVEFYDSNNNIAETTAQVNGVTFQGPRQVIADGLDGVLSGSLLVGQSLEMYGVNPAYLRSVGYQGFDNTISGGTGGFMIFSGSVGTRITASESYEGVGLEIVDAHSDINRYLKFRTNPSQFEVVTDTFFFGREGQFISGSGGTIAISSSNFFLGDSNGAFISGSQGNLQISSSNFSVDVDGNVTMSGFVSASGGHIGNFQIVEGKISGSNITMDANNSTIFKTDQGPGSDTSAAFDQLRDEYYIDFTPTEEAPDNYYIKFGPNFMVDKDGILIASGATFQGSITASTGLIGGFTIGSASLFNGSEGTPNFFFSGSANGSNFDKGNLFISSSGFQVNSQGAISASSGQIGGFNINTETLTSDSNELIISGSSGQITGSTVLFTGGKVGGWTLSDSTISSNNLILNSAGQISSQGYTSNQQGFFLGMRPLADGSVGAYLEVDEAQIRGTLKTTVFEKESVNAVGGQLHIANSTTITGSVSMSATETTMSVANASGFTAGEIILLKKFNSTGFTTEYMRVSRSVQQDPGSDTNFSGSLFVERALGTSPAGGTDSGSIGGTGTSAQEYTPGQVVVSTGKVGTGYIRLNANPNDLTTPYMDIVERTGTGVYDIDLKARLGDLSGITDTINGQAVSGFGLYTDNAFLKGGIVANYGSIGGFNMSSTDLWAGNATLGNTATKIVIGDSTGTPKIALGTQADSMGVSTGNSGVYMDGGGNFRVGGTSTNFIKFTGGTLEVNGDITVSNPGDFAPTDAEANPSTYSFGPSADFTLTTFTPSTAGLYLGSSNMGYYNGGWKTYMDSSGQFFLSGTGADSLSWNGSTLAITGQITVGSTTLTDNAFLDGTANSSDVGLGNVENFDADGQIQNSIGNLGGGTTITGGGITLSSGGIIKGGQTAFNTGNGFFIGYTGGQYKFSIGDGSTKGITWDGATMTIAGNVTIGSTLASSIESNANSALQTGDNVSELTNNSGYQNATDVNTADKTSGTVGAWTISPTTISNGNVELNASTEKIKLGSTTTFGSGTGVLLGKDGSDYELYAGNGTQYLWWNGSSLVVKGQVDATSGNFTSTVTIGDGATTGTLAVGTDTNKINIIGTNASGSTKIAASNGAFEMLGDGTATFANGNITFESDGDITSQDFLIERTRLFGAGEDGSKTLTDGVGTITSDDDGGTMFTESSGVFTQQRDIYCDNLTLDNSAGNVTLKTNGYRIFVKDTLTIESGCVIQNDGTVGNPGSAGFGNNTTSGIVGGTGGTGGSGAPSGTLKGGIAGATGGDGGSVDATGTAEHKASGGGGGGAGGSGGIVLIVARNISNSGTIRCNGGAGGSGGNGGQTAP